MGVGQLIRNVIIAETDPTVASFTKSLTSNNTILTAVNAATGTISASVLPSYVDDVLNFANLAAFPVVGETGKIYVTEDNNKTYRWSGSVYVEISSSATAGEALKLTNARTISTTGDATYSISFDGSANVSSAITLANTGVAAGTYNALSTQVRPFTVDSKGRITGVSEAINITPPWSAITGTPTTLAGYGITNALPLSGGTVTGDLISTSATISSSTTTGAIRAASLGITGAIFANTVSANSYNLISVGRGGGNVSSNTVVGVNAGLSNTTGSNNSFVGRNAGLSNTTGNNNSFVGRDAGAYIADGVTGLTISNNSCFFGMSTKGTQNATNENVFGYNATGNDSNTVTIGDNNIVRTYLKGVVDVANTTPSTSTTTGASVIAGGQGIGGNQHIGGFTSLGGVPSGHPAVKMLQLSGTTGASQGTVTNVAHNLTLSKIVGIQVFLKIDSGYFIPPGFTEVGGYLYTWSIYVLNFNLRLSGSSSASILSKEFEVLIFYKE